MAQTSPTAAASRIAPIAGEQADLPKEQARGPAQPFPLAADIPGRPFIRPHRLAQATRDWAAIDINSLRAGVRHVGIEQRSPLSGFAIALAVFVALYFVWQYAGRPGL
jgi:hypothetical protein